MKAIVCDKCKRTITGELLKETITLQLHKDFIGKFSEKHLCEECKSLFYKWIDNEPEVNGPLVYPPDIED